MTRGLTDDERAELATRREREELTRLREAQRNADFGAFIRSASRRLDEDWDRVVPGRELTVAHILRAHRSDVAGEPRRCGSERHVHAPGSMAGVACRLGVSETALHAARRRLVAAAKRRRERTEAEALVARYALTLARWPPAPPEP